MKKVLLSLAAIAMFAMVSCNSVESTDEQVLIDSTEVVVDTLAVDTLVAEPVDNQCVAITKAGERCKNTVAEGDTLCGVHRKSKK